MHCKGHRKRPRRPSSSHCSGSLLLSRFKGKIPWTCRSSCMAAMMPYSSTTWSIGALCWSTAHFCSPIRTCAHWASPPRECMRTECICGPYQFASPWMQMLTCAPTIPLIGFKPTFCSMSCLKGQNALKTESALWFPWPTCRACRRQFEKERSLLITWGRLGYQEDLTVRSRKKEWVFLQATKSDEKNAGTSMAP